MLPRNRLLIAGAAALALAAAAIGQEQKPESLLPPGFSSAPPAPAPVVPDSSGAVPVPDVEAPLDNATETDEAAPDLPPAPPEIPPAARRSLDRVGASDIYGDQAFGSLDGRYVATLMRGIQAPIASRWAEIVLRRALLARTPAPAGEGQADWVADRAALLLRLGESNGARLLVQAVDVDMFSPRLRRVAIESALAGGDPAGLCPLPDGAETVGGDAVWPMIRAGCAALSNDAATANAMIGRGRPGDPIDHMLAEKLAGAGGARRAMPIDWTGVDSLTDWRFGLATALNILVPQPLLDASPSWFKAWAAQAPMIAASDRIPYARAAAVQGVLSAAELVDLYGRVMDEAGSIDTDSPSGRLRAAYLGDDDEARVAAMHSLWDGSQGEPDRYAAAILTARAAARIAPDTDRKADVVPILGSLFAAGLDVQAARWAPVVAQMKGEDGDRAWALLSVGAPRAPFQIDAARLQSYAKRAGDAGKQRTAMLAAALAGLGRLPVADAEKAAGTPLGRSVPLTNAFQRAVTGNAQGGAALLAAVAMQSPSWTGVPPSDFYRVIAGLRAAGMETEARMLAAEAMTRL
ncbi:hypothetical protein FHS31_001365 [Sphingomonas vulcanisoli]|uniref:Uncharacterized protein n=1 Tax=Sphingomonas vulcanisoli TaxID=1658060 RepID=A0ABX0TTX9_9SPHN|nr:hypothetical protein [Sphingomonas vulcanisoli]NIJ07755.1 hypothetical protein [Sphingomonas vulcanisoli]